MYICTYTFPGVEFEWDPAKSAANRRKHGVRFADAVAVFSDDHAVTIHDDHPNEERDIMIGRDTLGRLLVVVHTWRDERIRIISARKATARERREHERRR